MSTEFFNDQWRIPSNENQNKISNYSMEFDGSSTKIDLGSTIGNIGVSSTTISFWLNIPTSTSNQTVLSNRGSGGGWAIDMFDIAGQYTISFFNASSSTSIRCGFSDFNTWAHIVFVRDGIANNKIYINGVSQTLTSNNENLTNIISSKTLTIGAQDPLSTGYYRFLNGKIDQLTFFDYALSQDQVTQLGAEGYAFNFNGSTQAIDCGAGSRFDIDQITVSGWVKRKSSISNFAVVAGVRNTNNGSTPYTINLSTASSKLIKFIVTQSNSTSVIVTSNTLIENDIWYHVVGVADGSNVELYVNGELQTDQKTYDGTIISPTQNFNIGRQPSNPLYYWDGELSNISVFNTGLTGPQVTTLYNSGKPLADISSLNPLGWWKLDDSELFNSVSTKWSIDNNKYPSTYKSSLNFIGSGQYLQVPDSNDLSFGNGTTDSPFSISAWINPDAVEAAGIVAKYVTGGWEWLFYVEASNFLRLLLLSNNSAGDSITLTTDIAIPINTWTHVSATYNANEQADGISLYINGSLQTDVTERYLGTYQAMRNTTAPVQIGTWAGTFRPINGQMSNVSIWDAELTETQVSEIYNNGTPSNLLNHSATSNLISWWELNNTTIGIQDSKGSNNASNIGTTKYEGFVNVLAGDSVGMNASNLVASNINGELIANPMATSPKPIAYYQLGDQSVDNGANYLVPNNSLSDYVFDFDGTDDSIDLGDSDTFSFGNGTTDSPFSISAWINMTSNASVFRIVNKYDTNYEYQFDVLSGVLRFFVLNDPFTGYRGRTGSTLNTGQWYHVVATYSGVGGSAAQNGMELYVNGQNVVSSASTFGSYTAMSNTTAPVYIGRVATTYSNGEISNAAIFNTELTGPQVQTIYNNGAPNDISSLNPTAWYKLNASEIFNSTSAEWSVDNNAYPSVYRSSLNFDGVNDYLDANRTVASNLDFSVSAWINPTSHGTAILGTRGLASASTSNGFTMLISPSGNLRVRIFTETSNNFEVQTGSTISLNNWSHVAMTYDSSTKTLKSYLNGAQAGSIVGTDPSVASIADLDIGRASIGAGSPHDYFNAEISNAAIFNTKLTSAQVTTIYNNGTPEASISHSPVSWYKLDNTTTGVQDSAGSNNGTNNGATEYAGFVNALAGESVGMDSSNLVQSDLQQTSGYSPYALSFDGVNDYLDCGDSNTFSFGNGTTDSPFSISAWVYMNDATTFRIVSKAGTNGNEYFLTNGGDDKLNFILYDTFGSGNIRAKYDTALTSYEGQWIHIVGTYSGVNRQNGIELYLNGSLLTTLKVLNSPYTAMGNTTQPLEIGRSASSSYANGTFSNVSVFNIELSSTQVTEIYNSGKPSDLNTFSGTAPVAWWQLGSNSSYLADPNPNPPSVIGRWTCLDEIGTNNAASSNNMTNDAITDGPGYSANGLGTSSIDIKGDAPYSTANGLSENMDVLDRTTDVAPS